MTTNLGKLLVKARSENIGIDVSTEESWLKSSSHNSSWSRVQSYVIFCTKGISNHLSKMVLAHELGHIEVRKMEGLNLPDYFEDPLLHELYAWKKALETEDITRNKEFFEFAQWQLNRYLFGSKRCLNETTDTEAHRQEIERLNEIREQ